MWFQEYIIVSARNRITKKMQAWNHDFNGCNAIYPENFFCILPNPFRCNLIQKYNINVHNSLSRNSTHTHTPINHN